jgi:hypothetical protein
MPQILFRPCRWFAIVDLSGLGTITTLMSRPSIAKQIEADIPKVPVQRHVEVLNEERDRVSKVPVRTDTNGKAS